MTEVISNETNELLAQAEARDHFRNYSDAKENVKRHYRNMRSKQTVDYNIAMRKKFMTFDRPMMVWDAMEELNNLIDSSDPDLDLPNIQHLFQSAEAVRRDGRPDWMQLTALLHDLGKVMFKWGNEEEGTGQYNQFGIVGDTFVVGCKLSDKCVYPEYNELNPDMKDERYNTELGIYSPGCGIDNLVISWGHDEYLYQVLLNHKENRLPIEAMWMIRYHSFYPWHTGGSYTQFLAKEDEAKLAAIRDFNQYDLYSKSEEESKLYDIDAMKTYYLPLIEKYLGKGPVMF